MLGVRESVSFAPNVGGGAYEFPCGLIIVQSLIDWRIPKENMHWLREAHARHHRKRHIRPLMGYSLVDQTEYDKESDTNKIVKCECSCGKS